MEKIKFAQKYLKDEFLRIEIRNKLLKVLNAVINQDYTEVFIIAHSFGVLVSADLIGHALTSSNKSIKFISLGNSLSFLSIKKYDLIRNLVTQCAKKLRETNGNECQCWIDYRAKFDNLSTQIDKKIFNDNDLNLWDSLGKEEQVLYKDFNFSRSKDSEPENVPNSIKNLYKKICSFMKRIRNFMKQYLGMYHLVYFQEESYIKGSDLID